MLCPSPRRFALAESMHIDGNCPGGNIVLERIDGDNVYLHQDLRDTAGDWFYWNFRVVGAAGRTLTFHFTGSNVIGVRGPAVSTDGGERWCWLGAQAVNGKSFRYTFGPKAKEVRFCFAMPYLQADLDKFLGHHQGHANLKVASLCKTKAGRNVERLHLGRLNGTPEHRVLITCRHHACEMMASHALEGLLAAVLADTDDGRWLCRHVELLVIPFMDKDGVEEGDQGKNRKPRDHNRDYSGKSVHREVEALRRYVPDWCAGRLDFALDMHDPHIRGHHNEVIYFVENDGPTTAGVRRFAQTLEKSRTGPLPYRAADNLAFGSAWNTAKNYRAGLNFSRWACQLPQIRFAAAIEIPYANASGQPVTAQTARAFGADLARALRQFLDN